MRRRFVGERLQQRLELYGAGLDDRAQVGARDRESRPPQRRSSSAASRPVSPLIAARSGRITGSGRKLRSSRLSRGNRPARRNDDLPAPDAPRMTSSRGGVACAQAAQPVERLDDRAHRGRRKCRHPRLRAGAGRDRAAGSDRSAAARRNISDRARPRSNPCLSRCSPSAERRLRLLVRDRQYVTRSMT